MRAARKFQRTVKNLLPVVALVVSASLGACGRNERGVIGAAEEQKKDQEAVGTITPSDQETIRLWARGDVNQRYEWAFSEKKTVRGVLDLSRNVLVWLDGNGDITWAPTYEVAARIKKNGQIKQTGSLEKRYFGHDKATIKRLKEEMTEVAGCLDPSLQYALVTLVRGAPRDPAAGPIHEIGQVERGVAGPDAESKSR